MITSRHSARYRNLTEPTAGSVYEIYMQKCKAVNEEPKSYKTFQRLAISLEKDALLRHDIKSLGRSRGITTLMYPGEAMEVMLPLVAETLQYRIESSPHSMQYSPEERKFVVGGGVEHDI